jgi:hypothetical protein
MLVYFFLRNVGPGSVAQLVETLPSKYKVLSSPPQNTTSPNGGRGKREREREREILKSEYLL